MTLSEKAKHIIQTEENILKETLDTIKQHNNNFVDKLGEDKQKAFELTKELVNAKTDEDKQLLASDESVAHSIINKKLERIDILKKQYDKPYFARFEVEEIVNNKPQKFEYKLGFFGNSECRIIDWRKAPISKLFYEYKEGEEFFEIIQGKERQGVITLKNKLEIEKSILGRISCSEGNFVKKNGEWEELQGGFRSYQEGAKTHLPNIISLITPLQFQMITEDAKTAVLIQGVAGSGKTTVALHRVAWLLGEGNSELKPEDIIVVVLHNSLKSFILETLPSMEIHGVRILTFNEWATESIKNVLPQICDEHNGKTVLKINNILPPMCVNRVKTSLAVLKALESYKIRNKANNIENKNPLEEICEILSDADAIVAKDNTRLLSKDVVEVSYKRSLENLNNNQIDECDIALILRIIELNNDGVFLKSGQTGKYGHIVADEIQDFNFVSLATIIGAVKSTSDLTLVGDTAQNIHDDETQFPGWEKLQKEWNFRDSMSRYITLTVSHRSTLPIMKLADFVQKRSIVKEGRKGRVPIWFKAYKEQKGVGAAIEWLTKAQDRYPAATTCVICRNIQEAKYALSLLTPTFGPTVRLGDKDNFSFQEGIIVTEISQVKGLEFCNVLLWNPSVKNYPDNDISRNLLYIAITRAEENLCIVTWSHPSEILPSIQSPLVRGITVIEEEEEE